MKINIILKLFLLVFLSVNSWSMEYPENNYQIIKADDLGSFSHIYFCHRSNFFPWPIMKVGGVKITSFSLDKTKENVAKLYFGEEAKIPCRGTLHWSVAGTVPSQAYEVFGKQIPILNSAFPYLILEKQVNIYSGHPYDFYSIGDHVPTDDSIIFLPKEELESKSEIVKSFKGKIIGYDQSMQTTLDISLQYAKELKIPQIEGVYVAINFDHFESGLLDSTKLPLAFLLKNGQFPSEKLIHLDLIDYNDKVVDRLYCIKEVIDQKNTILFPADAFANLATEAGNKKRDWIIYYLLPNNKFITAKEFRKWANIELIVENYDHAQSIPYKVEDILAQQENYQFRMSSELEMLFLEVKKHFVESKKDISAFLRWYEKVEKLSH